MISFTKPQNGAFPVISNDSWPTVSVFEKQVFRTTYSIRVFEGSYMGETLILLFVGMVMPGWGTTSELILIIPEDVVFLTSKVTPLAGVPKWSCLLSYVKHLPWCLVKMDV